MDDTGTGGACPGCGGVAVRSFYRVRGVPANSVLLMRSREEARRYPRGDIDLAHCESCGLISNRSFDRRLCEYSERYEETQACSPTFNAFHGRLADDLIERCRLRGRHVVEIGCGKGDFLALLCERGENRGIGWDPSFDPQRLSATAGKTLRIEAQRFTEAHGPLRTDLVCCKMTLEHIPDVARFVSMIRCALAADAEPDVFFMVPNAGRILEEIAFWDIYYEHCSYFTPNALSHLFTRHGFRVNDVWSDYDDQYLLLLARPQPRPEQPHTSAHVASPSITRFSRSAPRVIEEWRRFLRERARDGSVALWGSGSKAVSFLTTLGIEKEIDCAVDINPRRQGTFLAGSGHPIRAPQELRDRPPATVIVMNPQYREEIAAELRSLGLDPVLETLEERTRLLEQRIEGAGGGGARPSRE